MVGSKQEKLDEGGKQETNPEIDAAQKALEEMAAQEGPEFTRDPNSFHKDPETGLETNDAGQEVAEFKGLKLNDRVNEHETGSTGVVSRIFIDKEHPEDPTVNIEVDGGNKELIGKRLSATFGTLEKM